MIDLECMIKSLRLGLNEFLATIKGGWKNYSVHLEKDLGGLLLFSCNYDIKYFTISSLFYSEQLKW